MKKRLIALILIFIFAMTLFAGCAGNSEKTPSADSTRAGAATTNSRSNDPEPGDPESDDTARTDSTDDDDAGDNTPAEPEPPETASSASGDANDATTDAASQKPTVSPKPSDNPKPTDNPIPTESPKPTESPVTDPADRLSVEPPTLVSGEYFGSGKDAKFSLSVVIPASAFEFQGSYHGSGEVGLEVAYRDVGGAWIDWDEQTVNLWHVDQTASAISFLYPAEYMIPRTEFRVRLTYRYTDDSGEHSASSAWSKSANTMPDAPQPDGSEAYVGLWHSMNMLAAGWDERYAFHADGTYIYATSQINLEGTLIYMFGTWDVYEGALVMFPQSTLELKGARIVHDENFGDYYEGGKPELIVFEFSERSLCQIERGGIDPESGRATIRINGHTWYNFDEHNEYSSFFDEYDYYMGSM